MRKITIAGLAAAGITIAALTVGIIVPRKATAR